MRERESQGEQRASIYMTQDTRLLTCNFSVNYHYVSSFSTVLENHMLVITPQWFLLVCRSLFGADENSPLVLDDVNVTES